MKNEEKKTKNDATIKFYQEIKFADKTLENMGYILECIRKLKCSYMSNVQKDLLLNTLQAGMSEYQTHYANSLELVSNRGKVIAEKLFDFGEEVRISDIEEGEDRFKKLSLELEDLFDEIGEFKSIVTKYRCILEKAVDVMKPKDSIEMIKKKLESWTISEYEDLKYYIDENNCNVGDTAYMYSCEDNELVEIEIVHVISRMEDIDSYDKLTMDENILISGEEKFGADTSAEFITDKNSYMVWFKYIDK